VKKAWNINVSRAFLLLRFRHLTAVLTVISFFSGVMFRYVRPF